MKVKKLIVLAIAVLGFWHVSASAYMLSKAWLSQYLITQSWQQTLADKQNHKPWSWADTYPVATINFPRIKQSSVVLEGSSGRNLAFSVTHLSASGMPDENKTMILSGHRDSHFAYLQDVQIDDEITVQTTQGKFTYQISELRVVDSTKEQLTISKQQELILSTCYPFDTLLAGGSLRYVVKAIQITPNSKM
jgi:sortase A